MRYLIINILWVTLLLFSVTSASYEAVGVEIKPIRVGKHSYYVQGFSGPASQINQGFMSNAGFVITKQGVIVFDSLGTPALAQTLIQEIRKLTDKPIYRVIVSHYHADHYYGLAAFKDLEVDIWAHQAAKGVIEGDAAALRFAQRQEVLFPWVDENTVLVNPTYWLEGDTTFELGGLDFMIYHMGDAHSPEDLVMYIPQDNVLFSGDIIFRGRIPFIGTANTKQWLKTLDKLIVLNPLIVVPGHGAVTKSISQDIQFTKDYIVFLRQHMGEAVGDMLDFDEAYEAIDWSYYENFPAFEAANRRNAYNVFLAMEKELLN